MIGMKFLYGKYKVPGVQIVEFWDRKNEGNVLVGGNN